MAELRTGWTGGDGEAMTSAGHRYVLSREKGRYLLEREAGHDRICEVSRRHIRSGRQIRIKVHDPSEELVCIVAALLFHVLAIDYATDRRAMAAGGASGA